MRLAPIVAGLDLGIEHIIDGRDDAAEERILAAHGGHCRPACLNINRTVDDMVEVEGHVVEDVAEAFRHEPQIGRLPPDQQVERRVEELPAGVLGAAGPPAAASHMDVRPLAEVGAPGVVVLEQLLPDVPGDGEVEDVGRVVPGDGRGARGAELGVGEE